MAAPGNDMDLGHNDAVGDAILGPDGNPLHPLLLEVSAAEMQAEVDVIAQPLVAAHFPAGIFDVPRAIAAGHSFKNFKKLVKNVAILHEQGILPGAVASGTRKGIWDLHTDATLAQFVKFSRFVTAKEGQDLVYGLQRKRKIEEKAQPGQTPEQLHLVEILDVQRQKYSNTRKKIRVECEKEIDELQMQLRLKRKEMGDKLNALDAEYYPASAFEEPNEEEIGALSLQMYEVECQRTGRRPAYLPGGKTEYARKHYGAKARSNLMYEFATREEYKAPLVKFLAQEILNFRSRADETSERKLRHTMVAICGEQAANVAIERETAARRPPPCRPPRRPTGQRELQALVRDAPEGPSRAAPPARGSIRTRSRSQSRNSQEAPVEHEEPEVSSAAGRGGGHSPTDSRQ
ncbi:TPA_asm: hypothetical protein [Chionochloa macra amalgavirus 1]|nr:TPA_asm: hypothetical protein [Chionochloa macra amalgavirus 1]